MAHILVVDDDPTMLTFLSNALENAGHVITTKDNGLDAVGTLKEGLKSNAPFTLLLTDIVMPGMDGIELSRTAHALDKNIKVMFITGFSASTLGEKNPQKSGETVISKPFHLKEIITKVEEILAN